MAKKKKPWWKFTDKEIIEAKKHCMNCIYAFKRRSGSEESKILLTTCDYILIEHERRGCRVDECKYWKRKEPVQKSRYTFNNGFANSEKQEKSKAGKKKACTDHMGNAFPTVEAMCKHWGIKPTTYFSRLEQGWTLEDALAKELKRVAKK